MYRSISDKLTEWKREPDRKPLIIIGARQVGKTYSVREFAAAEYRAVLEINFQDDVQARSYLEKSHSIKEIMT